VPSQNQLFECKNGTIKIGELIGDWLESEFGTSASTQLGTLLFIVHLHGVPSCIKPKFSDDLVAVSGICATCHH